MLKEWLGALKVAKDIVKGGISAYEAGEKVDALIAKSVEEYQDVLTETEKGIYQQYLSAKDEDEKTKLRLAYLAALPENPSLPENFRQEAREKAESYRKAENFALESMKETLLEQAETEEQREGIERVVEDMKQK